MNLFRRHLIHFKVTPQLNALMLEHVALIRLD